MTTSGEASTTTDIGSILERLTAAADDLEAKREAAGPALELRNELIVMAREHPADVSYTTIARAARCSRATVFGVLATH